MDTMHTQASHDSVISTTNPRRFNPWYPITILTALKATDATSDAWRETSTLLDSCEPCAIIGRKEERHDYWVTDLAS
jgi:hypothetical protein